jgi:hypothetical protein
VTIAIPKPLRVINDLIEFYGSNCFGQGWSYNNEPSLAAFEEEME